ncbi:MAG: O-antigen ligase family protein [Minwuia sp.]|nr:O-antigen ligase family protein [Minwuia sp.]
MSDLRVRDLVLAGTTLLFVLLSVVPFAGYQPWVWIPLSLVAGAVFILSGVIDLTDHRSARATLERLRVPVLLFFAVILWALIQTLDGLPRMFWHPAFARIEAPGRMTLDAEISGQYILRLLSYGMVFWIACRLGRQHQIANTILLAVGLFGLLYSMGAVVQVLTGSETLFGVQRRAGPDIPTGTFNNANSFAFYVALCMVSSMVWLFRAPLSADGATGTYRQPIEVTFRMLLLLSLPAGIMAIGLSVSRAGAIVAMVGVITVLVLAYAPARWRALSSRALLILIAVAPVLITLTVAWVDRDSLVGRALLDRVPMYGTALKMVMAGPLAGTGLGTFEIAAEPWKFEELYFYRWDAAHNVFLEHLVEMGPIMALLFWAALLLVAWQIADGFAVRRRDNHYAALGLVVLVMAALHNAIDYPLHRPAVAYLFVLLIGVAWAQSWSSAPKRSKPRRKARSTRPDN